MDRLLQVFPAVLVAMAADAFHDAAFEEREIVGGDELDRLDLAVLVVGTTDLLVKGGFRSGVDQLLDVGVHGLRVHRGAFGENELDQIARMRGHSYTSSVVPRKKARVNAPPADQLDAMVVADAILPDLADFEFGGAHDSGVFVFRLRCKVSVRVAVRRGPAVVLDVAAAEPAVPAVAERVERKGKQDPCPDEGQKPDRAISRRSFIRVGGG